MRYFESDGASVPAFTMRTISTTATGALSLFAGDYDRDGDLDVLVAATAGVYGSCLALRMDARMRPACVHQIHCHP